jgi:hypothetical protein
MPKHAFSTNVMRYRVNYAADLFTGHRCKEGGWKVLEMESL